MKKALAILILLSILCAPNLSYSKSATSVLTELVVKKSFSFEQLGKKLGEANKALRDVAVVIEGTQSTGSLVSIQSIKKSFHSSSFVVGLMSQFLLAGSLAYQGDEPQQYFGLLRVGLNNARLFIQDTQNTVKAFYPTIENKAALYEADKGRQLLSESLKLIDETLSLLPLEK